MKVSGSATLDAPPDRVWATLRDPQALARTIPGCEWLETVRENEYRMTVTTGVEAIRGTYVGTAALTDGHPPDSFVLRASGAGDPGTVDATVTVSLSGADGDTTRLEYSADTVVGGRIAGVGQRLLASAAKRTADEFFAHVDAALTGGWATAGEPAAAVGASTSPETAAPARPEGVDIANAAATPRPGPLLGRLLRAPAVLYELGGAPLLGHRFLLLVHRGWRTGLVRRTVLEVVRWNPAAGEAMVVAGFGPRSAWLRNVEAGGALEVRIGRRRFVPEVRLLDADEAIDVFADYERRNRRAAPLLRAVLTRLAGFPYDGSDAARRRLVATLPMVAFREPAPAATES